MQCNGGEIICVCLYDRWFFFVLSVLVVNTVSRLLPPFVRRKLHRFFFTRAAYTYFWYLTTRRRLRRWRAGEVAPTRPSGGSRPQLPPLKDETGPPCPLTLQYRDDP